MLGSETYIYTCLCSFSLSLSLSLSRYCAPMHSIVVPITCYFYFFSLTFWFLIPCSFSCSKSVQFSFSSLPFPSFVFLIFLCYRGSFINSPYLTSHTFQSHLLFPRASQRNSSYSISHLFSLLAPRLPLSPAPLTAKLAPPLAPLDVEQEAIHPLSVEGGKGL